MWVALGQVSQQVYCGSIKKINKPVGVWDIYTNKHIHIHIPIHIHIHIHIHIYIYIYIDIYIDIDTYTYIYIYSYMYIHIHIYIYRYIYRYRYRYTYSYRNIYIYIYYTYKSICIITHCIHIHYTYHMGPHPSLFQISISGLAPPPLGPNLGNASCHAPAARVEDGCAPQLPPIFGDV